MPHITNGHYECTTVIFNPMVPLNPDTNEAIYCTMRFVVDQGKKIGLCCGTLTFDQPLYLKANHINYSFPDEFVSVHLRLGGFHQLMSFLGAGCKLFKGS